MAGNNYYRDKQHGRRIAALEHIMQLATDYHDVVKSAQDNTSVEMNVNLDRLIERTANCRDYMSTVSLRHGDVLDALQQDYGFNGNTGQRRCILNYASHINPGGGFVTGASAQEETLCMHSGLYPCLAQHSTSEFYVTQLTEDLVSSSYIYTKDCPFFIGGSIVFADVLTMSAPDCNKKDIFKNPRETMTKCMEVAFRVPALYGVRRLYLGAWGCGVFRNSIRHVAEEWQRLTYVNDGMYETIIHPLLSDKCYDIFDKHVQHRR